MSQLLLRDVGELIIFIVREVVARVVLDNTKCIFAVNVARAVCIIDGRNRYVDIILEQRVAVCSLELCPDVLVVLNAFKDDLALFAIPFDGVHCCCRGFFVRVSGNIPDALVLIKLCNYIVAIGRILRFKEDVIEHRLFFFTVAKGFRDVRRIRVNMRVVDKGVVVGVIGTLPCEDDFVFVSVVTVNQRLIRIEFCVVTDTKCVIAVTCIELAVIVIVSRIGCVDLGKAIIGHGDRHRMRTVVVFFARNFEFAVGLLPRGNFVGAICIGKEFECNAVRAAYIREAAGQNILERIRADIGGRRRDRRQCGDDLIFYGVACGCRCVVCKAVGDNIRCVIYAGVFCSFTHGFFQCDNTRFVFGVEDNIVVPILTAGRNLVAGTVCHTTVNSGHRETDKARICCTCHHFRCAGFNQQIETYGEAGYVAVAVLVRFGHCRTTVVFYVGFERILNSRGIGFKSSFKCCTKYVGLVIPVVCIKCICVFIAVFAVCKADSSEHICAFDFIDCIQHLNVAVGTTAVFFGLRELRDVRNFEVSILDTFNCIAVACLSITKCRRCAVRTGTRCATKHFIYFCVILAGRNVAVLIPHAIFFGVGKVILINGQLCLCVHIDGSFIDSSR